MSDSAHVPVLLDRVVALVAPPLEQPGSVLVDATLGLGGHTAAVLTRCPQARVIGIDRDTHALDRSRERLARFADLIGRFRQMAAGERARKVEQAPGELVGVTLGDDLARLIPAEATNLGVPALRGVFAARYDRIERRLDRAVFANIGFKLCRQIAFSHAWAGDSPDVVKPFSDYMPGTAKRL